MIWVTSTTAALLTCYLKFSFAADDGPEIVDSGDTLVHPLIGAISGGVDDVRKVEWSIWQQLPEKSEK